MAVTRIKKSKKNTLPAQDQPNLLASLPPEVMMRVANLLVEKKDISALARVNNEFGQALFRPRVTQLNMVDYLSDGQLSNLESLLQRQPELLLKRFTFNIARSGHPFVRITPFQFAYGAGDAEMCKMMLSVAEKNRIINVRGRTFNTLEAIKQQVISRFPADAVSNVYDVRHIAQSITDASQAEVNDELALKNESDSAVRTTLEDFRRTFKLKVFNDGMHFNIQDLVNAYSVLKDNATDWDQRKKDLFWRQVIGYMHSLLPACDLQAFRMTLFAYLSHKTPLNRIRVDGLFTSGGSAKRRLGLHFALDQEFDESDLIPKARFVKSSSPCENNRLPDDTFHPVNFADRLAKKKIKAMKKINSALGLAQDNESENTKTRCTIS